MSVEFLSYFNEIGCTNVPDISWVTTAGNWKTVSGGASAFEPAFNWVQWVRDHSENDYYNLIYIDSNNYLRLVKRSGSYQYKTEWCYNGTIIQGPSSANNADQNLGYFAFGIDDDNQIGYMSFIKQRSSSATTTFAVSSVYNGNTGGHQTDFYNLIKNSIPTHQSISGGAGSGYIGNSLLSNKKMVGYNVPTSDATNTKTESVLVYSPAPFANMPKMGDGFARIKFLRDPVPPEYRTYIDQINGSGFYWKDYNNPVTPNGLVVCKAYPFKDYSWCAANDNGTINPEDLTNGTQHRVYTNDITNIYINGSGDSYTCSFTFTGLPNMFSYAPNYDGGYETTGCTWDNWNQQYPNVVAGAFNQLSGSTTVSLSGTLEYVFQGLQKVVRNVNIYVNNVLWSSVNNS